MASLASITYRTPSGTEARCVVIVDGNPLTYRVLQDEPLASCSPGDLLLDFEFEHRLGRTPFRAPISKLPPIVTRIRWGKVRVRQRQEIQGEPLLIALEPLSPPEDLTTP